MTRQVRHVRELVSGGRLLREQQARVRGPMRRRWPAQGLVPRRASDGARDDACADAEEGRPRRQVLLLLGGQADGQVVRDVRGLGEGGRVLRRVQEQVRERVRRQGHESVVPQLASEALLPADQTHRAPFNFLICYFPSSTTLK